ncbi:ribosome biogenesis protein ENP2 [Marchantia polymorpha subsp. ruderalis]|uniref:NUC153 domain-containing protein n=2 Tax=Marchantia polymorpha TaxID=3197 RepID=A0AAF6BZC7_MARPO|nr:hypothetical protein MARPO_0009s0077 [Marchantia polymorpha]BBN17361.1 hypothetical protein Mp_7g13920 [Marchantia polymorpha subsp. ruderalis]|eukprot:PTQ46965.1 hypothetical protein MARPO_0009s0077 [Marchantia polymorpha]
MSGPGGMKVTSLNGVKVYAVSGQRSFATWVAPAKMRALRKDDEYMRRIELLQDLQFDTASTRIKATRDGQYLVASGIYPPQVKVYELKEMSLKFERHLNSEIVDFQVLSEDYSKMAFLCADRSVCLHAKFGSYFSTRIPRMGRDLSYDCWSCDLLVAASSQEIYRLNLEQGRFLAPLQTESPGVNVLGRSLVHGMIAAGGDDGAIECYDLRQKASIGRIDAAASTDNPDQEITALRFDEGEGILLAAGTSSGQVLVYDLRSSKPIHTKDHMYGAPIIDIKWHESVSSKSRHLITTDTRVMRIWEPQTGKALTSIESPAGEINDVCVYPNSGLIFMALDSPRMSSYFVPSLGPAPSWCSFLENLTEELEENPQTTIYDDFKFVTRKDLEALNLTNLLGTNLLRAYMHGFFIDHRLYNKAKSMADPFAYEEYRNERVLQKMDAERAARITIKTKLPKVNKELAARILKKSEKLGEDDQEEETGEAGRRAARKKSGISILKDDRFAAMFEDEAYQVDEGTAEYKALHPNVDKRKPFLVDEHFDLVSDKEDEESEEEDDGSSSGDSMDDGDDERRDRPEKKKPKKSKQKKFPKALSESGPRFYEAKDEVHAQAFKKKVSLVAEQKLPLGARVEDAEKSTYRHHRNGAEVKGLGGSRQISFNPKRSSRDESPDGRSYKTGYRPKKRGIQELGLKSDSPGGRGRGRGGFRGGRGGGRGGGGGGGSRGGGRGGSRGRGRSRD